MTYFEVLLEGWIFVTIFVVMAFFEPPIPSYSTKTIIRKILFSQ
jgi:hypothetical protein